MEAPVAYAQYLGGVPRVPHGLVEAKKASSSWKWAEAETAEAFGIDDLLNFSNIEDVAGGTVGDEQDDDVQQSDHSAESSITVAVEQGSHSFPSDKTRPEKPTILGQEDLCVACDDIAQLEWLSTFVEDSFSTDEGMKFPFTSALLSSTTNSPTELSSSSNSKDHMSPHSSVLEGSVTSGGGLQEMAVPGRARSKRSRAGVRVWSSRLLSANNCTSREAISTSSVTVPSFFAFDCPAMCTETEFLTPEEWEDNLLPVLKKPTKIFRKKPGQDASQPRRCTHCLTQRTPQWRAGPMGPKTLCNACGVRFKSGRLLPEYRPAGSPTFVSDQHSNSHRKVLEMRKQKIADPEQQQTQAQTQAQTEVKMEASVCDREQSTCERSSEERIVV